MHQINRDTTKLHSVRDYELQLNSYTLANWFRFLGVCVWAVWVQGRMVCQETNWHLPIRKKLLKTYAKVKKTRRKW